jgi:hypothetical protein
MMVRMTRLRHSILELDRLWGVATLGLALCEKGPANVSTLAHLSGLTEPTCRRQLAKLVMINRARRVSSSRGLCYEATASFSAKTVSITKSLTCVSI